MLKYILKDVNGKQTKFGYPLSVTIISSNDAPADSLTAVFAVYGEISEIAYIVVENEQEKVFNGIVDMQTIEKTAYGILLTVNARSMESILLDNEAMPQTYLMPSVNLLMKKHLIPLGFTEYIGENKTFNGEFKISKGMSEWAVLNKFCNVLFGTNPKINSYGIVDFTGSDNNKIIISNRNIISEKRVFKRKNLISEVFARTYNGGNYEMQLTDEKANELGVKRKRYINTVDSKSRTIITAKKIIEQANKNYIETIIDLSGCVLYKSGTKVILRDSIQEYEIMKSEYVLNSNGEKTRLYLTETKSI